MLADLETDLEILIKCLHLWGGVFKSQHSLLVWWTEQLLKFTEEQLSAVVDKVFEV